MLGNLKQQGSGTLTFNNEVYESQENQRREIIEWTNILAASRTNPTLAELVKELKTVYELSNERPSPNHIEMPWGG